MQFRNIILKPKPERVIPCANFFGVPVFKVLFKVMLLICVPLYLSNIRVPKVDTIKLGSLPLQGGQVTL